MLTGFRVCACIPCSQRTALEARCRAAEEALAAAERRHAVEVERLQVGRRRCERWLMAFG